MDGDMRLEELRAGDAVSTPGTAPTVPSPPEWFDPKLFQRAKDVYSEHFAGVNFGHLCGLLLSFYFTKNIATLRSTGASDSRAALFRRYLSTVRHVRRWYEGDVWDPKDAAARSLAYVRAMHARVARRMAARTDDGVVYVSQWDMAVTQWAFVGTLVLFPDDVGLGACDEEDLEAMVHFWRAIGWLLGIEDEYNLCAGKMFHVESACRAMLTREYAVRVAARHPDSARMANDVVNAMRLLDPSLSPPAMQTLCRALVGLPPSPDDAMGWADWASHHVMGFIMRHATRYEATRRALNALTRWRLDAADRAAEAEAAVTGG